MNMKEFLAKHNIKIEDVVWEYLRDKLKITFEEAQNEDEICRVFLDGHGVEIVHLPEEVLLDEIREKLIKLAGKNVYVLEGGRTTMSGLLKYAGTDVWYVESGKGTVNFHINMLKDVNGNNILMGQLR